MPEGVRKMRGVHDVVVRNNKVQIKLTVSRNLTILQGKSATGKTTLLELIAAYDELGANSGVVINAMFPAKYSQVATGCVIFRSSRTASCSSTRTAAS